MNFLLLLIFGCASASSLEKREKRIVGAKDAHRRQFPYIVALYHHGRPRCGGTIVSRWWIVSAAHCFSGPRYESGWIAIAGLLRRGETHHDVQRIPVANTVIHEDYILDEREFEINNDIALLRLRSKLTFTKAVRPARLPEPNQNFFGKAWLSGWGTYKFPNEKPITLQCLEMEIISNDECRDIRENHNVIPPFKIRDTILCTTVSTGRNSTACFGDSGGPLVQNGILIGVVSFGDTKCGVGTIQITNGFTRVSQYIEFIESHARDIVYKH